MVKRQTKMQKPHTVVTKLADLAPRTGHVLVERPNGEVIAIPIKELTYKRFWEIARLIPDPVRQKGDLVEYYKDETGKIHEVYATSTAEYQKALVDANNLRVMWRLTEFVDLEFEGRTVEERVEELQNTLSVEIINALNAAMSGMMTESEARVESRSESFHTARPGDNGHLPAVGLDIRAVAQSE